MEKKEKEEEVREEIKELARIKMSHITTYDKMSSLAKLLAVLVTTLSVTKMNEKYRGEGT